LAGEKEDKKYRRKAGKERNKMKTHLKKIMHTIYKIHNNE